MITVRGTCAVFWKPAYTLALVSSDGTSLDADGKYHDLVATLTKTATGAAVPGRTIKLATNPTGEIGHRVRKFTGGDGTATFRVADSDDEVVEYTASLIPKPPTSEITITATTSITWGDPVMAFVQKVTTNFAAAATPQTDQVVLATNVVAGQLIVICHHYGDGVTGQTSTIVAANITDTVGTTYALATSLTPGGGFGTNTERIYYGIAAGSGANTVSIPISGIGGLDTRDITLITYTNPHPTTPLVGVNGTSQAGLGGALVTKTPGSVSTISGGIVVTMNLTTANSVLAVAGPAGTNPTAALRSTASARVYNATDLTGCITGTASADVTCKMTTYIGVAASFRA